MYIVHCAVCKCADAGIEISGRLFDDEDDDDDDNRKVNKWEMKIVTMCVITGNTDRLLRVLNHLLATPSKYFPDTENKPERKWREKESYDFVTDGNKLLNKCRTENCVHAGAIGVCSIFCAEIEVIYLLFGCMQQSISLRWIFRRELNVHCAPQWSWRKREQFFQNRTRVHHNNNNVMRL